MAPTAIFLRASGDKRRMENDVMARTTGLPIMTAEGGVTQYFQEIRRYRMLEPQEEFTLAKRWRENGDREAAHRLVSSHLRLGGQIPLGHRRHRLPSFPGLSRG